MLLPQSKDFGRCIARHVTRWQLIVTVGLVSAMALNPAYSETSGVTNDQLESSQQSPPSWLAPSMSLADARHLVGRTGFGGSPDELLSLKGVRRIDAVQRIVDNLNTEPAVPMPAWVDAPAPRFWSRRTLPQEQKQAFDQQRDQEINELRQWWVNTLLQTDSPQTERLVMFWHDHFATSYDGINRRSIAMARQNQLFRSLGTGSYRDLIKAIIRDPAMLIYLDNQNSRVGKPNENLARELLELFTLGEGNYNETTVKEAARALTGYGLSETQNLNFRFYGYKHDHEDKTLFGNTANHNGDSLVDLILQQDAAAEYLVKKFWHAFVSDAVPDTAFVNEIAEQFRQSNYDLTHLYQSVLSSEAFWHSGNRLSLIKSPATLLVGTARTLDYPKRAWTQLPSLHALLGMDLFSPPNVSGWNEGVAFVAPGRLLNRQLAVQTILSDHSEIDGAGDMMMSNDTDMQSMGMQSMNMQSASDGMVDQAGLIVRLAGHFYRGAPQYRVMLFASDHAELWRSDDRQLVHGYDTEKFGEMRNMNMLPWHNAAYSPDADIIANTHTIKVEFLNDDAGKAGDRNLFVESVTLNGETYSTIGAVQQSHCVPKNKRYAGALYCAGTVALDVSEKTPALLSRNVDFSATSARSIWTRHNNKKLDAIIALENVQTPNQFYHTLSFHLRSTSKNTMQLSLDNYSCWPDCIDSWPECAWQNENAPGNQSLVFPVRRNKRNSNAAECHYQGLSDSEQALVNSLYVSLPQIFREALVQEKDGRHQSALRTWLTRIDGFDAIIANGMYANNADTVVFDAQFDIPMRKPRLLPEPMVSINSLLEFNEVVSSHDLTLPELLIGGADVSQFPELLSNNTDSIEQQIQTLITHPVFQVY